MKTAGVVVLIIAFVGGLGWLSYGLLRQRPSVTGPAFVAFIVDSTSSVHDFHTDILSYAENAIDEYSKLGPIHLVLVNLTEKPSKNFEDEGEATSSDVDEFLARIKAIDYSGRGTDIVGALELVQEYYGYAAKKRPPSSFRILCFTDGLVQSPRGQRFRSWGEFDWQAMARSKPDVGIYFLSPAVRREVEAALAPLGGAYVIREKQDAIADARDGNYDLPGVGRR